MPVVALSLILLAGPVWITEHPASDPLGVNANELRLKLFGGYRGERLTAIGLKPYQRLGPTTVYADRHGHLYADRDGDGVVDAGVLFNRQTGMISADWDCNQTGDQVLADIKV